MPNPSILCRLHLPLLVAACVQTAAPPTSPSLSFMVDSGADTDAMSDTDLLSDIDVDQDGYCEAAVCSDGSLPGDCDDTNPAIHPAQTADNCNGVDEDCDGETDEDCSGALFSYGESWYYTDSTSRSWDTSRALCATFGGELASLSTDAENDAVAPLALAEANSTVWLGLSDEAEEGTWIWLDGSELVDTPWNSGEPNNSGSAEHCGMLRNDDNHTWNDTNCGGSRPPLCEFACDIPWYVDADEDGDGAGFAVASGCGEPPEGYSATAADCDDSNNAIDSTTLETCDGAVGSCSGILTTELHGTGGDLTDAATTTFELEVTEVATAADLTLWWTTDHDAPAELSWSLTSPEGTTVSVANAGDSTSAFAGEALLGIWTLSVTDGTAETTGSLLDWSLSVVLDETDLDMDGFLACEDCNDDDPNTYPGAPELLDGVDNDCDGLDLDADADGFDASVDCDDSDNTVYPGAPESTDGIDSDCDGLDRDDDGDGSDVSVDCDDSDAAIRPDIAECPGETDSDCDSICDSVDLCIGDDATGDVDADGYCVSDIFGDALDCDDTTALAFPGNPEVCGDEVDNDCDGEVAQITYGDTYSAAIQDYTTTTVTLELGDDFEIHDLNVSLELTHTWTDDLELTLTSPSGTSVVLFADDGGSSDDPSIVLDDEADNTLPDSSSITGTYQPQGNLSDFDGQAAAGTWTLDIHDDALGDEGQLNAFELIFARDYDDDGDDGWCDDCNDRNFYIYTGNEELAAEGIDQDCDGFDLDEDGDGVESVDDCDDNDATVTPAASGCVDDLDSDCDGVCDASDLCIGDDASGDADLDGWCATAADGTESDCDDTVDTISPGELELCDGADVNCSDDDVLSVFEDAPAAAFEPGYDGHTFTIDITEATTIGSLTVDIDLDVDVVTLLGLTLTSPTGTTIELMEVNAINRRVDGEQWLGSVTFDDQATRDINDLNLPIAGTVFPTETLATFGGETAVGTWTLFVQAFVSEEGGTLNHWALNVLSAETDSDLDGFLACQDCGDADDTTYPGATELFDDVIDNNCDGIDLDADNDGYTLFDDCDDTDPEVHPGAEENCWDGVDTDCDGTLPFDEYDLDGDGWRECGGDCGPDDDETWPGADELCDGIDNDCDGFLGEDELDGDADGVSVCDGDCVGDDAAWLDICPDEDGDGELADTDCDDRNQAINSSATTDACNGLDDDCDGAIDEDCACTYIELDGNSYLHCLDNLDFEDAQLACEDIGGSLAIFPSEEDFDSVSTAIADATNYEGITTWMGLTDQETEGTWLWLDGSSLEWNYRGSSGDDELDCTTFYYSSTLETSCEETHAYACELDCGSWYVDADGDGYGTGEASYTGCGLPPAGHATVDGDCDDQDASVTPALSSDCDTFDLDDDGYCVSATCVDGSATGDCDDADATRYAGATELCDGIDNDCDGTIPAGEPDDSDADGVCDSVDLCEGDDSIGDTDGDGTCDDLDACPLDSPDDADADGQCDSEATDTCFGYESAGDSDGDGVCDELDLCDGDDATGDTDADSICDELDTCDGNDLSGDLDADGVCNDLDPCPFDAADDSDGDGSCDSQDLCEGDDSSGDTDGDGVCDNLSLCEGDESLGDADGDGLCDVLLEVSPGPTTTFSVSGARAGSRVYILYSTLGEGGSFCHPTIDLCADLRQPSIGPNVLADAEGHAELSLTQSSVPTETFTYRAVWLDSSAQQGESSNAVAIPPPN